MGSNATDYFGVIPFWFLNDDLNDYELIEQINAMNDKGIKQFIVHARKGLLVEYLSDQWFYKIGVILSEVKKLGMNIYIYDEENWPSGYASGKVLEETPEACAKHIRLIKKKYSEYLKNNYETDKVIAIFDSKNNLTLDIQSNLNSDDEILIFIWEYTKWNPAYCEKFYPDLLDIKATELFMKYTHLQYEKHFKEYFNKEIIGFFVDEPGFYCNLKMFDGRDDYNTIPYTFEFKEFYANMYGEIFESCLPHVFEDTDFSKDYRRKYYSALCELYRKNFLEPQKDFCEKNGMKLIGHLHTEDFLPYQICTQGNMIKALSSLSYVGTDRIDLNDKKINEKFISSVGHIHNSKRIMSETFANSGWGLSMKEIRRWTDWQYVRGINLMVPHAFYSSIEGDRRWECPPSMFAQNPYWKYFEKYNTYISNLSRILSEGKHIADVAVLYPMHTAFANQNPYSFEENEKLDIFIQNIAFMLLDNQQDFDFLDEDAIDNSNIEDGKILLNNEVFTALILPATKFLDEKIINKIIKFVDGGGIVILAGEVPNYNETQLDYINHSNIYFYSYHNLRKNYTYELNFDIISSVIYGNNRNKDLILFKEDKLIKYLHRQDNSKHYYFIVNEENLPKENKISFRSFGKSFIYNLENSKITEMPTYIESGIPYVHVKLAEFESIMIMIDDSLAVEYSKDELKTLKIEPIKGKWEIEIDGNRFNVDNPKTFNELGYGFYSGEGIYRTTFNNIKNYSRCYLKLTEIYETAEIYINNVFVDTRLWSPFEVDITNYLEQSNSLKIIVSNTLSNEIENKNCISGIGVNPVLVWELVE